MKILSNWAAENKDGATLILMKSARGRDIDSQMVHIAEYLKPDYFAACPNIALNEDELDSNMTKEKYSHIFPEFLTFSKEDQLQEVSPIVELSLNESLAIRKCCSCS